MGVTLFCYPGITDPTYIKSPKLMGAIAPITPVLTTALYCILKIKLVVNMTIVKARQHFYLVKSYLFNPVLLHTEGLVPIVLLSSACVHSVHVQLFAKV